MRFTGNRFKNKDNKETASSNTNNINNEERHPQLNYLLNAPTPYCLSLEEIYGDIPKVEEKDLDINDPLRDLTLTLSSFLENETGTNGDGVRPNMDEHTFVKVYLPRLYNGHLDKYNAGKDFSIAGAWKWSVAGKPFQSVDILRNGQLLFRVPPLLGSLDIVPSTKDSITNMYMDLKGEMDVIPSKAPLYEKYIIDQYTDHNYNEVSLNDKMVVKNLKNLFVIDEIFTYYGYDSILTPNIMSVKNQIMQGDKDDSESIGAVSPTQSTESNHTANDWDEDDLFG